MNHEHRIIEIYLTIEAACRAVIGNKKLRQCGRCPELTDTEVLTMEIFGEMQGHHDDAAIWRCFDQHWRSWFPKPCQPSLG